MTKNNKKPCPVKAGQYYAAAYNGNNGDLIVGQVKSVRRNGEVILENFLTDKTATKKIEILLCRNKRIAKAQADQICVVYTKAGKAAARKFAVGLKPYTNGGGKDTINPARTERRQGISREELLRLHRLDVRSIATDKTILEKEDAACISTLGLIDWITGNVTDAEKIDTLLDQRKKRDETIKFYQERDRIFCDQLERIREEVEQLCRQAGLSRRLSYKDYKILAAEEDETHDAETNGAPVQEESSGALHTF